MRKQTLGSLPIAYHLLAAVPLGVGAGFVVRAQFAEGAALLVLSGALNLAAIAVTARRFADVWLASSQVVGGEKR